MWLLAKPGAACITDYSVSTPLSFERNGSTGNELEGARLELTVHLEVAASELLQQPGGLAVVADVLLLDGTPLLRDRALAVEQVCVWVCVLVCVGVTTLCLRVAHCCYIYYCLQPLPLYSSQWPPCPRALWQTICVAALTDPTVLVPVTHATPCFCCSAGMHGTR